MAQKKNIVSREMEDHLIIISDNLRILMNGMSSKKLAEEIKVDRTVIDDLINRRCNPTLKTITKISTYFKVSILIPIQ